MSLGRPIILPGVIGDLARAMGGLLAVATATGVPERTLRYWARNEHAPDALGASKIADLCTAHGVQPRLYEAPNGLILANTPIDGWVWFETGQDAWAFRARNAAPIQPGQELTPATTKTIAAARASGWPY